MSVYNGSGADIGPNLCVMGDSSVADGIKLPAAIDSAIKGVTRSTIKNGEWGDIVVAGGSTVPIKNTGGIAKDARLMPQTDGTVATFSVSSGSNASLVGLANEAALTGEISEMQFVGPAVSRQG